MRKEVVGDEIQRRRRKVVALVGITMAIMVVQVLRSAESGVRSPSSFIVILSPRSLLSLPSLSRSHMQLQSALDSLTLILLLTTYSLRNMIVYQINTQYRSRSQLLNHLKLETHSWTLVSTVTASCHPSTKKIQRRSRVVVDYLVSSQYLYIYQMQNNYPSN